jgi:hypothetical protein
MQPIVERRADGDDAAARTCTRFQDNDRSAGFVKEIGRAQAGETRADDHDRRIGVERTGGDAWNGGEGQRQPTPRLQEKSSAVHVLSE